MEDCLEPSFAASGCSDNGANSSALARKPPKNSGIDLRSAALLSMSASAQDLSALDKEREKLDESSPRSVLGDCIRSLECEMDSPSASSSDYENEPDPHAASHWRGFFRILKDRSMRRLPTMHPMRVPRSITKRSSRSVREDPVSSMNPPPEENNFCYLKPLWRNFTLPELQNATNDFNPDNIIGRGGYAEVYKGRLENGVYIAIKRLTRATSEEKIGDFLAELGIIVHVKHPNTAKLMGYGTEGGMHLVFQLSRHGSLASLLHDGQLGWSTRYKIALGTAKGLHYLHEDCQRRIIHRDIKSSNILLTEDFEPQISDFGLAKWLPKQLSHLTLTKFEGTIGYLAPEYFMHGIVDEKTDVFAFGVLLLELITGRRALDNTNSTQQSLQIWAKPLLDKNNIRELVDPSLGEVYDREEMNRVTLTASLCIQDSSLLRPQMSQVVQLLRSQETSLECRKKFQKPHHLKRTYSDEFTNPAEYSNSRYINDLRRHRQIALGTSN